MARIRKTEPAVTVSAAAAAPARRKTATAQPKQATASKKPRAASAPEPAPAAGPATETKIESVESSLASYSPAQEEIAELAYSYWVSRGCRGGSPEEDWLQAERELLLRAPALA